MKLIVGLGNPGSEYQNTWHNLGFIVVDQVKQKYAQSDLGFKVQKKFKAEVCEVANADEKIILAKPTTFMNNSGAAVKALATFYKINPADIWIIHDEIDLPLGKIRISHNASAGGHKGVQSIIDEIGSQAFVRFRVGIRPNEPTKIPTEKYVLQKIDQTSKLTLEENLQTVLSAIEVGLATGIAEAMNEFN
ncbi:MAG: aminoacyl-tRNA hydrolase [Candidatus Buchananbacteria bacterium]|nr:aminoacyl-tRNA hydrolase [Candidatus Buchananbacteria bacterium]